MTWASRSTLPPLRRQDTGSRTSECARRTPSSRTRLRRQDQARTGNCHRMQIARSQGARLQRRDQPCDRRWQRPCFAVKQAVRMSVAGPGSLAVPASKLLERLVTAQKRQERRCLVQGPAREEFGAAKEGRGDCCRAVQYQYMVIRIAARESVLTFNATQFPAASAALSAITIEKNGV